MTSRLQHRDARAQGGDDAGQVAEQPRQPESLWLTANEALDYLRLTSRSSLNYASKQRGLPYHRFGSHLRFYRPELDAWLLATGSGTAVEAAPPVRRAAPVLHLRKQPQLRKQR